MGEGRGGALLGLRHDPRGPITNTLTDRWSSIINGRRDEGRSREMILEARWWVDLQDFEEKDGEKSQVDVVEW